MKSTAIVCAIGAILVSAGTVSFAQGVERGDGNWQRERQEQREQWRQADGPQWHAQAPRERGWRRQAEERRVDRREERHDDQQRDVRWRDGREQLLVVQGQEQRYEQPAYGPLTVVVQMPALPAVAVVGTRTEATIVHPVTRHVVAKASHPAVKRAVVAKAAECAAPAHVAALSRRP